MTNEKFNKTIKYLSVAYPSTFKLDLTDSYAMNVWYDILKSFDDDYFVTILKDYATHNVYAPNSPASLIEWAKEMIMRNIDCGGTFEKFLNRIRENAYDLDKVIGKYEKGNNIAVAKTLKELRTNIQVWRNDSSQLPYLKREFEKIYMHHVTQEVNKDIFITVDSSRLLGTGENT